MQLLRTPSTSRHAMGSDFSLSGTISYPCRGYASTQKWSYLRGKALDVRRYRIRHVRNHGRVTASQETPLGGQSWFEFSTPEGPSMSNEVSGVTASHRFRPTNSYVNKRHNQPP
eukprot:8829164-Pyramimonas_sp.AAC.2